MACSRDPGIEGLKHVESLTNVVSRTFMFDGIAPAPAKGKAIGGLETAEIDVALGQQFAVRRRKIVANHAGHGGWARRSARQALA